MARGLMTNHNISMAFNKIQNEFELLRGANIYLGIQITEDHKNADCDAQGIVNCWHRKALKKACLLGHPDTM